MIKVLELFGGIGACSKALEKLNIPYQIVDYVEIDKYAVNSFNAIHNTKFEPQDIKEWDKDIDVDLIMHGSPCQDFSLAGKQAGGDKDSGTRSSLMYETIRIVEKLKPRYVIWENVKNLVSKKHIHNFKAYIQTMENLGYKNYYKILNAKDYGIPQNRERIFTVSILDNQTENNNILSAVVKDFKFPKKKELKLKLKDLLEDSVDESFYLSDEKIQKIAHWKSFQKPFEKVQGKESVVPTLTARGAGEEHSGMITYSDKLENTTNLQNQILKKQLCNYLIQNDLVKENDVIRHSYSKSRMENWDKRNISANNYSPTLDTRCDCFGVCIKNNTKKGYLEAHPGDGVYTNTSTKRGTVQKESIATLTTFQDKGVVMSDLRIRKLTPKECWRLMGFEDSDYEKASQVTSKAQLYKQAGNSIVVNILEEILAKLLLEKDN